MSLPGIKETAEQIRAGTRSPVDVVSECLERIGELNPELNAFISVVAEQALAAAREAERAVGAGQYRGPLHGIPIAIKDFYDTVGIRTTAAFKEFAHRVPAKDAIAVAQLKRAGAIIVGKTNMHELGQGTTSLISHFGAVKNPLNADYIAGGSSGGSAAAVATGMCFATLDTDAVGSCRLPAACCGVTGFKGTYGLISLQGVLEGEKADPAILALAHAAVSTRSAADTVLVLEAMRLEISSGGETRLGRVTNFKATQALRSALRMPSAAMRDVTAPFDNPGLDIRNIE